MTPAPPHAGPPRAGPTAATTRLYLEDARRKTALAVVTGQAGGGFTLDRTLFHVHDARYHHRQPCDRGHALVAGSKLKIVKVAWDARGLLVHRISGDAPLPPAGAKAQLHLDAPRRELQARAHTLMHVLLAALAEARAEHLEPVEVVGGGEVRCRVKARDLSKVEARVRELVATRAPIEISWMPRDEAAKRATPQHVPFSMVASDEPTVRMVRIGEWSALPCDAPLVEHVWQVGDVKFAPPQVTREGVRLRAKVA